MDRVFNIRLIDDFASGDALSNLKYALQIISLGGLSIQRNTSDLLVLFWTIVDLQD